MSLPRAPYPPMLSLLVTAAHFVPRLPGDLWIPLAQVAFLSLPRPFVSEKERKEVVGDPRPRQPPLAAFAPSSGREVLGWGGLVA